jgi:phosphoadenosine phosphosulfate reductase
MSVKQAEFDIITKEQVAMDLLREHEPLEGYQFCHSFGKDSSVAYDLTKRSGVKYRPVHSRTGIDPPELIYFARVTYPEVNLETPKYTIWEGIVKKGLPRRQSRWCCELLKEYSGAGKFLITGIRAQESSRRKARKIVELDTPETPRPLHKSFIHPIFGWTEADVWAYIHAHNLPYCDLYDIPGWTRIGCIMCPMQSWQKTLRDWERYPSIAQAWFRATERYHARMWPKWVEKGSAAVERFPTSKELIVWWLTRGQISTAQMYQEIEQRGFNLDCYT